MFKGGSFTMLRTPLPDLKGCCACFQPVCQEHCVAQEDVAECNWMRDDSRDVQEGDEETICSLFVTVNT